jgi:DNA-binding response OmpR family regulator
MERALEAPWNKQHVEQKTVLLLEREASLRRVISVTLKQLGIKVWEAADASSARETLKNHTPDIFVLELDLPDINNGELIDLYRDRTGDTHGVVFLTTTQRPDDNWREEYQPDLVVYKPFDIRYLCRRIRQVSD